MYHVLPQIFFIALLMYDITQNFAHHISVTSVPHVQALSPNYFMYFEEESRNKKFSIVNVKIIVDLCSYSS